ncbi:RNA polymerase III, subunit Rpc25 [Cynara cardunculus var. scolymus]|uniref:DNA-directed RNA polymerase subunit n=1 Tax=Cynara cardunculus var. scolymus TaxID=59895 RepID=A0A103XED7_CYNCS|nr:RNA polymerase III, subunit Rpc25 [Cynara cardunculus var. scolymus]
MWRELEDMEEKWQNPSQKRVLARVNMFNLSKLEHTLRLQPHLLSLPINEAVKGELESLFLDKVIANLGLCISVYDIESIDGGFIFPNEGAPTYTVKFRLIIFRPFVGEIISAKLKESNADGLRFANARAFPCCPRLRNHIRFRVQNVKFPEIPKEQKESKPFAPMEIIGSLVSDGGLGPISWWV